MSKPTGYDFAGYITRYGVRCTDGRRIMKGSFNFNDGDQLPTIYNHQRDDLSNIIGKTVLQHRDDGVYGYTYLNDNEKAKMAKECVKHGDIDSYSIYANQVTQSGNDVTHARLREVSLVVAGANDGAHIDDISFSHGLDEPADEIIIYPSEPLEHSDKNQNEGQNMDNKQVDDNKKENNEDEDESDLVSVLNTLNDEQQIAVSVLLDSLNQDNEEDNKEKVEHSDKGGYVRNNLFEEKQAADIQHNEDVSEMKEIIHSAVIDAKNTGRNFRDVFNEKVAGSDIEHADSTVNKVFAVSNIGLLFPDATSTQSEPTAIVNNDPWVDAFYSNTDRVPRSRIRTYDADLTVDEMRARGYVTGNAKAESVFKVMKRETSPTTIYNKARLNRDDILDVNWFDILAYTKRYLMESFPREIARAALFGDGRKSFVNGAANPDKINEENIRPIWLDDDFYTVRYAVPSTTKYIDVFDEVLRALDKYQGSGTPTLFANHEMLTEWKLQRVGSTDSHYLWDSVNQMADKLGVASIQDVRLMPKITRVEGGKTYTPLVVVVNPKDYGFGTDKGGQITAIDDFDINFNQQIALEETRLSGALTRFHSAIVIDKASDSSHGFDESKLKVQHYTQHPHDDTDVASKPQTPSGH